MQRWRREPGFAVRQLERGVPEEARAVYRRFAHAHGGMLDRGAYLWSRLERARGEDFKGYGFYDSSGEMRAYAYVRQFMNDDEHELVVQDLAFSDGASGRALLGFFAGYGMLSRQLLLRGGPAHPLLLLLEQQHFECTRYEYSMNRVVDVAAALAARGYNPQLACELELAVTADPVFGDNVGCFRVAVRDGRAEVTRVREPCADALSLDVRALASLYGGFFSPAQLALTDAVGGTARGLDLAALVFSGPTAAMPDMF